MDSNKPYPSPIEAPTNQTNNDHAFMASTPIYIPQATIVVEEYTIDQTMSVYTSLLLEEEYHPIIYPY